MTSSSGRSRRPSNRRAYRSSTRPALTAKTRSRTNSHERCCHGLIASSASQRQIVAADASVTPRWTTSRCSSVRENRPSGNPCVAGNSHAIALTSATCSGGKTARATRARLVLQTLQALLGESSSPLAHDPGRGVQPRRYLGVVKTLSGIEHDPRPLHITKRHRLRARHPLKLAALLIAELDPVTRRARHDDQHSPRPPRLLQSFRPVLPAASTSGSAATRDRPPAAGTAL